MNVGGIKYVILKVTNIYLLFQGDYRFVIVQPLGNFSW